MVDVSADYLFEASWEVCNKVGGIYTVVKSKAALMNDAYTNYFLVGPYISSNGVEFQEKTVPIEFEPVFRKLEEQGIKCHFGYWQIKGNPKVILIDFSAFAGTKNDWKKFFWEKFKIDSINSGWDFEEPMLWSVAVGKLIEEFQKSHNGEKIVGHFHEWMSGFSLLYLKDKGIKVGTTFTTHATMLGRSMSGVGVDLYGNLDKIDPYAEAYRLNVQDKFTAERACAEHADAFTTVSEITGMEAEALLGRKPDVLVLNGLDIGKFPTFEETALMHRKNRDVIRRFISYYFFPYYFFDIEQTLTFFIVGRYEYKNKGIDIFIKSLAKLNARMKEEGSKKTIVVFFWIPREVHGAKMDLSINKLNFNQIEEFIDDHSTSINNRIIHNIMSCPSGCEMNEHLLHKVPLFNNDFLMNARKMRLNFVKRGNPPLTTHNMYDEESDAIITGFKESDLLNKKEDKVKVIFYPVYLTGVDGLIDLPYYEAITGCHLGLFPSYYEPWGYTPLESAALGVPSLTTDLGGFGRFLQAKTSTDSGIYVIKRFQKSEDEAVNQFYDLMYDFTSFDRQGRVNEKLKAKELAHLADWKVLINNYFDAHNLAVKKVYDV